MVRCLQQASTLPAHSWHDRGIYDSWIQDAGAQCSPTVEPMADRESRTFPAKLLMLPTSPALEPGGGAYADAACTQPGASQSLILELVNMRMTWGSMEAFCC